MYNFSLQNFYGCSYKNFLRIKIILGISMVNFLVLKPYIKSYFYQNFGYKSKVDFKII